MIHSTNYILKEIQDTDIENIHKGLSNPAITKYYDVHFPTLEDTKEQMEWYKNLKQEGTGIWWSIYDQQSQAFCGAGGFNSLDKEHRKAEIGLWLLTEYWGKGILKEVMPLLFEQGFSQLNLNRIEGYVVSDNVKCKRALEKINFTYEGTMRAFEIKDDKAIDVDFYSILRAEWKPIISE